MEDPAQVRAEPVPAPAVDAKPAAGAEASAAAKDAVKAADATDAVKAADAPAQHDGVVHVSRFEFIMIFVCMCLSW